MKQSNLLLLLVLALPALLAAQNRYFDPVFAEVKFTANVTYGTNATVLYLNPPPNGFGQAVPQSLKMDVYEPENDTATARPLIILLHFGGFLPPQVNGGCNGAVLDGEIVELAQRLAQRGFIVAAADYRLGWNPVAATQTERTFTLVNAAHRGVQDSRTCVRFFKKDHAEGDQFRIDPEKITLWGLGTGGWISLASATLDTMGDWIKPKFLHPGGLFVYEPINGNLNGTSVGVAPPNYPPFPIGDTLCYPNHVGYDSDFALAVNMAGVLLDTSWLQPGDVPVISFSSPTYSQNTFSFEPCGMGDLAYNLPLGLQLVLPDVAGSCAVQARQTQLGNNVVWQNAGFDDPLTAHSLTINESNEGFYPFWGVPEYAPWAFSTSISPYGVPNAMCDTGFVSASAYLDTVLAYFAPRACAVLGLNANCNMAVSAKEPFRTDFLLKVSPNPAVGETRVRAAEPMLSVGLYDLQGRLVQRRAGLNATEVLIQKESLPSGAYLLKAHFARGLGVAKVVWE